MGSQQVAGTWPSRAAVFSHAASSSYPGGGSWALPELGGRLSDGGPGAESGPRVVSPPFGLSQAEVKPEPRLEAELAPAPTGQACASTPSPSTLAGFWKSKVRVPKPLEQVRRQLSTGGDRAAVEPGRPRLTLLSSSWVCRAGDGASSLGARPALSAPTGGHAAPRAPPGAGGRRAAAGADSDGILPVRRRPGV